jgi:hypothetical protein
MISARSMFLTHFIPDSIALHDIICQVTCFIWTFNWNEWNFKSEIRQNKDKREDFDFTIVNFPFLCSNIQLTPAYGVYISHLIRYLRACFAYRDFWKRGKLLTNKLMLQGYNESRLKSSFCKFYGRYNDLVCNYKSSLAHKLNDLFDTIC